MAGVLGLRGTGDWAPNQRPENWREGILLLNPNGTAPLTALLSKVSSSKTDDPTFHWWTKQLQTQSGTVTGVYTDVGLSSSYTSGGTAGQTLYFKMSADDSRNFRIGHQVLCRDTSDLNVDVNGKVTASVQAGANSYVAVKLLEADDNSANSNLSNCDTLLVIGSINPEAGERPQPLGYDPVEWSNNTQIFRNSLEISRTARLTRLRTGDAYKELKRETLEYHMIEMEKAFLWGVKTTNTGANGKPERTTMGLIPAIKAGAPSNVFNYTTDPDYSGQSWLTGGEAWLDAKLEQVFRYGSRDKLAFAGSGAVLAINKLAKAGGQIQLTPNTIDYGLKVMTWITPFGQLHLMIHPLFSYEATNRNSMVVFEPRMLRYRYITDTYFRKANTKSNGTSDSDDSGIDGTREEFLTEAGLEYHHPITFGYFTGFDTTNTV